MADVDWDKVAWDEPNEGGDEEVQAQARYQEKLRQLRQLRMGDAAAWDEPTQSTPVEDIRKVEDGVAAFARWKEEEQEKVAAAMAHVVQQQTTALLAGQAEQRPLPEEVKKVVQWADRHGCLEDTVPGHAEWARREDIVGMAPLPEDLHPGNEGAFLLDEQGNVRTLEATAHPESLHIQVGNLEVVAEGKPGAAGIPFCGNSRILVDGKPFPVKSLVLRGNVDGLWTVEMEFYPRQPKE
jgi:hypothetical protein